MTMIAPPAAPGLRSAEWKPGYQSQENRAEFTDKRRITILAKAARWKATCVLPPILREVNVIAWRAWIMRLNGIVNSFPLVAVENRQISGVTPHVTLAGQAGLAIESKDWGSPGPKLLAGQFVTIDDQLLGLTQDVIAGSDGKAILTFDRHIRLSTTANAPIVVDYPYARMSLVDPDTGWMADVGQQYAISFGCKEWW